MNNTILFLALVSLVAISPGVSAGDLGAAVFADDEKVIGILVTEIITFTEGARKRIISESSYFGIYAQEDSFPLIYFVQINKNGSFQRDVYAAYLTGNKSSNVELEWAAVDPLNVAPALDFNGWPDIEPEKVALAIPSDEEMTKLLIREKKEFLDAVHSGHGRHSKRSRTAGPHATAEAVSSAAFEQSEPVNSHQSPLPPAAAKPTVPNNINYNNSAHSESQYAVTVEGRQVQVRTRSAKATVSSLPPWLINPQIKKSFEISSVLEIPALFRDSSFDRSKPIVTGGFHVSPIVPWYNTDRLFQNPSRL